jgi:hypothetical protein
MTPQMKRVRWAVRATLWLGLAASIVGNILHAERNAVSQAIAAWPVIALYLTIELISRVPVHRRWLTATRLLAAGLIAGIAAWVSYHHMAGVASRYGETGASPYLLPLSVDGLIVVASICLVELGGRIRAAEDINEGESDGAVQQQRQAEAEQRDSIERQLHTDGPDHSEAAQGDGVAAADRQEDPRETAGVAPAQIEPTKPPARKPHTTNPDRVRRAYERNPEADPKVVAGRLNLSLATVKKYRPPKEQPGQVNGKVPDLEGAKS